MEFGLSGSMNVTGQKTLPSISLIKKLSGGDGIDLRGEENPHTPAAGSCDLAQSRFTPPRQNQA